MRVDLRGQLGALRRERPERVPGARREFAFQRAAPRLRRVAFGLGAGLLGQRLPQCGLDLFAVRE
ncbi:hypothetical protein DID96_25535 [Burkholderia sp. Bp8963]|uniref:hypothetical protein n=1 Tax=Burkholderia sp. Bp8963 TaxID=2184547 RepID=UPI000F59C9A5|nr:hypothetical protein [Burkholderia sp. Bp8963]RQS65789.1 hypothetical protein DID96_25535 [Burkholderia sp. Bp8963]